MPNLENDVEYKLEPSELDLLLIEMGFFSDLKRKQIGFNKKSFSNLIHLQKKMPAAIPKENLVDLHIEVANKIDELITKNEGEAKKSDLELVTQIKRTTLSEIIEIRGPSIMGPQMPIFRSELAQRPAFGDLSQVQEFIEIEPPANFITKVENDNNDEFQSWMAGDEDKKSQKSFWGLGKIKIKSNIKKPEEKETKKVNGVVRTKVELDETKKEIEEKKRALEEAIRKEKQKEIELKKEEEQKLKQEKLKKLELKKKLKEAKIKEKEAKIKEKEERIKQEKLEKIELKRKLKEEKIKEKEAKKLETEKLKGKEKKEIKEEKTLLEKVNLIKTEKQLKKNGVEWDDDVAKLMPIIDSLFDSLPDNVVDEFANSKNFELYEKVMLKYKHK